MSRLSATEAAQLLGVSLPTLYAYVSRGLLQSLPDGANRRHSYDGAEVRLLARRRADAKRAGKVAERSLAWGVPVLESRITQIADGALRYRGHDALALATTATLEEVAALLWDCAPERIARAAAPDAAADPPWAEWMHRWRAQAPLERALVLLPAAAATLPHAPAQHAEGRLDTACALMRTTAAALAGATPSRAPIHLQLAEAWDVRDPHGVDLLRMALVLCADHELNPSTFAVRCIASTGAHLYGAIAGGLAALAGPRHGGETRRVTVLLDEAARADDPDRYLAERLAHDERTTGGRTLLAGFDHPLYPQGDPRAAHLTDALRAHFDAHAPLRDALALAASVETATTLRPTIDFALALIERTLALPPDAAFVLFAAGRVVGWIAHAIEQQTDGGLIRPRARYIGADAAT